VILVLIPTALLAKAVGCFSPPPAQPSPDAMYSAVTALVAVAPSTPPEPTTAFASALVDVYWIMMEHTRDAVWLAAMLVVYQIGVIAPLNPPSILASPVHMLRTLTTLA